MTFLLTINKKTFILIINKKKRILILNKKKSILIISNISCFHIIQNFILPYDELLFTLFNLMINKVFGVFTTITYNEFIFVTN